MKSLRKFRKKLEVLCSFYDAGETSYDEVYNCLEGWNAYTKNANDFKLKEKLFAGIAEKFENEISSKEINRSPRLLNGR